MVEEIEKVARAAIFSFCALKEKIRIDMRQRANSGRETHEVHGHFQLAVFTFFQALNFACGKSECRDG